MHDDFYQARREAHEEIHFALLTGETVPALFVAGEFASASEELAQWLLEEVACTASELVQAVGAGTLAAFYPAFCSVWAERRARQLAAIWADREELKADALGAIN